jgi:sporulation delaying protein A
MAIDTRPPPVRAEPVPTGADQDWRVLRGRLGALALLVLVLVGYVAVTALPAHPLSPAPTQKVRLQTFLPEGWGFFTISPRRPQLRALRPDGGSWISADAGHLAVPAAAFGVNRVRRAQGTEIALLLRDVPAEAWTSCAGDPDACLSRLAALGTVDNGAVRPSLCGSIGFVRQEPLPWSWRSAPRTVMPSSALRLEVRC